MSSVWIYADSQDLLAQLVTAARQLEAGSICAACTDAASADFLAACNLQRVLFLQSDRPESCVDALAQAMMEGGCAVALFGASPRGREIAASVAARLNAPLASEAVSLRLSGQGLEAERYVYGGMGVSSLLLPCPACASIAPGSYPACEPQGAAVTVEMVEVAPDSRVSVLECAPQTREGGDLGAAARVVCVGRGLEKREDMALIEALAQALGAEIACSRGVAEDYKWLPLDRYVGISGAKIKADLHISVGISGQVQHVAGIRDAKCVVAVDSNENAPIFRAADYGIVGNLYDVLPLLTRALN